MSMTQEKCDEFWSKTDKNGDGFLTIQELAAGLRKIRSPSGPPTDKDIAHMFHSVDKSGDNKISKQEFVDEMLKPPRSQTLRETFQTYDKDGSGSLSRSEIEAVIRDSNCFEPDEVEDATAEVFASADKNDDGSVTLDEFMACCS